MAHRSSFVRSFGSLMAALQICGCSYWQAGMPADVLKDNPPALIRLTMADSTSWKVRYAALKLDRVHGDYAYLGRRVAKREGSGESARRFLSQENSRFSGTRIVRRDGDAVIPYPGDPIEPVRPGLQALGSWRAAPVDSVRLVELNRVDAEETALLVLGITGVAVGIGIAILAIALY